MIRKNKLLLVARVLSSFSGWEETNRYCLGAAPQLLVERLCLWAVGALPVSAAQSLKSRT